ncbi:CDF family zinc transporter ZitB [Brenneria goodwinii]|uniref:CDF family zinc transporter ZitB n=1 Tax=Brenneria goodwinii TaxID=1109412 RepID=UPI000EF29430|nr:CDF family zinc transporter ZitB [Brenneria goodwinii]MCG8156851.1 CDF family zinc transporter ZitB [Brenneria goodwinii]MCG8163493.1 CDF family zinc transporter ZitB [Brenneria goodwinii]MCG8165675.1 CDF family zinc transporter ZitB [Brenneria goodwinii]MCG8170163.1 CDF family zinc transporter ZitB [Brenneria goodwinii]MCG8174373.1 CDF family zinc transporter ZitB [Brenneria goodwinii]
MAHSHNHAESGNSKRLLAAFIVTATFMVAEIIGGLYSGSLALIADAGHMLTDAAALFVALLAVRFAQRKPNARHTFGYLRLTTLAAFVNALTLVVITAFIFWEAIQRFYDPQPVASLPMLLIAIAGLVANLVAFWLLHHGSEEKNINVRAAALHVLGDLLGSVGAIVAALIILFTDWTPIDPILSILVSCLVLRSAWALMKESIHELLEGTPNQISVDALKKDLTLNIPEVRNIHHVHLWQVGEKPLMTLHAQVIPPYDHDALLNRIQDYLLKHYQIGHSTIQMEYQRCDDDHCDIHHAEDHHHHH